METVVKKWGAGAMVRIPARVMAAVSLEGGPPVGGRAEDGRIDLDLSAGPSFDLKTLVNAMRPETFRNEWYWGAPLGGEVW